MQYLEYILQFIQSFEFIFLCACIIVDIITGNAKAFVTQTYDSKRGISGSIKHLSLLSFTVLIVPLLEIAFNGNGFAILIIIYFILQYLLSIIENLGQMGVRFPSKFQKYMIQLHEELSNDDHEEEKNETRYRLDK